MWAQVWVLVRWGGGREVEASKAVNLPSRGGDTWVQILALPQG